MRGAEGIVHEDVGHGGELLGKLGVVLRLALFKAGVLKQHHFAVLQGRGEGLCARPDDVLRHLDRLAQQLRQALCDDLEAQLRLDLALRLAHVGAEDDLRPVLDEIFDRRQRSDDTLVAGDDAALGGHVEVAAAKHALALYVDVFYRFFVVIHTGSSFIS